MLVHVTHSLFHTIAQKHWVLVNVSAWIDADDVFLIFKVSNKVQEEKEKKKKSQMCYQGVEIIE